nr:helix-turn-helix domain-containing protein [Streptomyces boncukensis]
MLRAWRRAADPAAVPGRTAARGHRSYLTQLDMALLLGVSERWYRALEKGEDRRYGREMIDSVARLLRLSPGQRAALFRGTGLEPPPRPAAARQPDPSLVRLMHEQRCASWLSDQAWDVLDVNAVAARHCPWLVHPGANVMLWAFSPEARYQLRDWETRWSVPLLRALRLAWHRWPDNRRLDEVVRTVRGRPGVPALWDAAVGPAGGAQRGARREEARPVYFPLVAPDPVPVRVVTCAPFDDATLRWTMLLPVDPAVTFP